MLATNRSAGVALSRQSEQIYHMQVIKRTSKGISPGFETQGRGTKQGYQ